MERDPYLDCTVRELLAEVAARSAAPGGGSVAALVAAFAAGLVAMGARFAEGHWDDWSAAVGQAEALRARLAPLAHQDAVAYERALEAMRQPEGRGQEQRDFAIRQALELAAEVPLTIAEAAADVAELGILVAQRGNPNVRPDTIAGVLLATAATRIVTALVEVNLATREGDARLVRARHALEAAEAASRRAAA